MKRKLGSRPRLCWPLRIKRRLESRAPAVSDRWPAFRPAARHHISKMAFSVLSDVPPGCPKGRCGPPLNCKDAQRRADKRAGTPNGGHLDPETSFAKPFFGEIHAENG